jgi:hypothetical protein
MDSSIMQEQRSLLISFEHDWCSGRHDYIRNYNAIDGQRGITMHGVTSKSQK